MENQSPKKKQRRSFSREYKLGVVDWYLENERNIAVTARRYGLARKQVRTWVNSEEKIQKQKPKSKASGRGCTSKYPIMEGILYDEYKQGRENGRIIKRRWFDARAKQLISEHYPDEEFKHSDQWFNRFCRRFKIAFRRKTHVAQAAPKELEPAISKFHASLLRVRRRGEYKLKDIANMDQTPLPFVLDDHRSYADKGSKEVWCASAASGLDKRQCTVQLTIFGDGIPRIRPFIIFRGQGLRISHTEQDAWYRRVHVVFQKNAWCDEAVMKRWINELWGNVFVNPATPGSTGKILVADVHRAQQTDGVKALLKKTKTELVNIPPGCTSRIQPLDVCFNKPFKDAIKMQFEKYIDENLDKYKDNKFTASDRRILITKWVANAWAEIGTNADLTVRSFEKCGISLPLDGSLDKELNIEGLPDYQMPTANELSDFSLIESESESDASDAESEATDCDFSSSSDEEY